MLKYVTWRLVFRVALVLVAAGFLYFVVTFVQVWMAARSDDARPSQAIVVLGAAQYDGRPSNVFRARLDHAADLYDDGIAPTIVVTGGKQEGDRFTEATAGADYLHSLGVPDSAILRETTSRSSWESLSATANFLEERGIDPGRAGVGSVPLAAPGGDRGRARARRGHFTARARARSRGLSEWWRFFTETLRVGAGRISVSGASLATATGSEGSFPGWVSWSDLRGWCNR